MGTSKHCHTIRVPPKRGIHIYLNISDIMHGKVRHLLLPIGILVLLWGVPVMSTADFLLVADDNLGSITQVNMADGTKRPLPLGPVTHPQAVSYDPRSDHVYWTDYWDEVILRAHRNGSGRETLVDSGVITADGLTLDLPGGNMFWTDRHAETVSVARLDGRYVRTLVSQDVGTLGDIVVDPANGYMFWTDWGVNCRIERAAMDGTGRVVLISYIFGTPRGLAIDYIEQRIYWSDAAYRTIQSVDLSGQNQIHLTMFRQAGFFGLALDNLNMYWTSWNVPYVVVTPKSSPNRHHALASGFPSPNGIYVNRTDAGAIPSSACSLSNGGCRELCLARPGGRTCACRNSWALQNDSASCSPIVPVSPSFLWIDRERTFDTSSVVMLAGDSSTVRGSPGSFPITTLLTVKPPSYIDAIDYDFRQNLLFWVNPGQKKIYMNLYYTDGVYNWIGMVNYNTSHHHVIIQAQLDRPRGTVVHPIRGFLFWNDWGEEPKIERATLSGQNRTVVVKENLQRPSGMVIDYANDRLFWADTGLDVIESCDLDGSNRRLFYALPGTLFYDITFDGREIVIADWYHDRLIFANGTDEVTVGDSQAAYIFGVEFYDESRQPWIQSECQRNNGDCQHTCVGGPDQHTCLCLPGYDLDKDKHTCIESGHSFSSALLVATDEGIMKFPHNIADLHMMADLNFTYAVQGDKVIAIDYDHAGKMLFYVQEGDSGMRSIRRLELLGQNDLFNIHTSGGGINSIAVDWVSSNLYWTETLSGRIYVSRLDGSFRHVLIDNLNQPRGLAVHPPERLLFWTEVGRISRASLAGTNRRTVVPYNMNSEPIGIAIDLENDRLYWVDSLQGTMQSCNLTGGDVLVHWQADHVGLYGVTTFKDYVLWTDNTNHVIRMGVNNAVGQFVTTRLTELSTKPYGIRMYQKFQQMLYTVITNTNNSNCYFTFYNRQNNARACCFINQNLNTNASTCNFIYSYYTNVSICHFVYNHHDNASTCHFIFNDYTNVIT
ncbi:PREDICTED: low-density lipoprotein receptor-related protein 4-like [Branchiostoma belcheri]|uniref:Low-density lipoprotein receptor-related protein 4-like n=1 Tax=Branchiostoma belcheri TaxID=7741 RepID=A0A6P4XHW4_BRABE|nr:PREDICTED: low-density lipoprotein receptor-related protein 4-like [Branchiostoma belcheri]